MIMPIFVCNVVDLCDIWHYYIYMYDVFIEMHEQQAKKHALHSDHCMVPSFCTVVLLACRE